MLVIRLVLRGQIETHAEVLVIPNWCLLCDVVEDGDWSGHLNFLLFLRLSIF